MSRYPTAMGIMMSGLAVVLILVFLTLPAQPRLQSNTVDAATFQIAVWHQARVQRLVETPVGTNSGAVDIYSGTVEDTVTHRQYAFYRDGNEDQFGEAPLPLGLFVAGDMVQIQEGNGHVCAIAYQSYALLTGEAGC